MRLIVLVLLTLVLVVSLRRTGATSPVSEWDVSRAIETLAVQTVTASDPFVWWEAEDPTATNFPPRDRHPFAPQTAREADVLSHGQWLGVEGKREQPLFLEYQVKVPATGAYFFYTRKFWQHGPFRWRWDNQPWQQVGTSVYLMDSEPLREFVGANWVSLGQVQLASGTHRFRLELTEQDGAAALDCFVLTRSPFQARGKLKPNQRYTAQLEDGFLFDPGADPMAASPIDLRDLNEPQAGSKGFIQVKGEDFIHAQTGEAVKFWAVNVGEQSLLMDRRQMATMARFLAKRGVNMVRVHAPFWAENDLNTVSPRKLAGLFALVTELKQQGIYTTLSIYFPVWLKLQADQGFAGYTGQSPFALLFFNSDFQQRYYGWWRTLLTTPNPHTGIALRDDPALAMVELVNEDSYFFWTFTPYENVPAPQMALLETQFGTWLAQRYQSLPQAFQTWASPQPVRGDDVAQGRAGFLPLYDLVAQRDSQRAQDTAAFLATSQQQFFTEAIAHLRQTLGYKGTIYASNWITANAQILGPLDKLTNTAADFMDRHGYFVGPHEGERASYSLNPGETYQDRSALTFKSFQPDQEFDFDLPIMDVRYNGKPSTMTEINWAMPNRFRAEFPLLAATYGALQGTDGFFFFATNDIQWQSTLTKFAIASPTVIGQFPATALMYRRNLIAPGQPVADVMLPTKEVMALRGAPLSAPQNLDEFRAQDIPPGQTLTRDRVQSLDPLAFLVGKVNLRFGQQATAQQVELSKWRDREAQIVRSHTGQLLWDYRQGLMTVNAPQAQGATGFLRRSGAIPLETLNLQSDLDYGTILLVALDDQPLQTSRRMLLQVMSEEQNLGWKTTGSPEKTIHSTGNFAIAVRHLSGIIALNRPDARQLKVTALDLNGYPAGKVGHARRFKLQPETLYYLIAPE